MCLCRFPMMSKPPAPLWLSLEEAIPSPPNSCCTVYTVKLIRLIVEGPNIIKEEDIPKDLWWSSSMRPFSTKICCIQGPQLECPPTYSHHFLPFFLPSFPEEDYNLEVFGTNNLSSAITILSASLRSAVFGSNTEPICELKLSNSADFA